MSWEDAWNNSQYKLSAIQDALRSLDTPRSRIIRIGQLDSELLDLELVNLLTEPLRKTLSLINTSLQRRFDAEIQLLIQLVLYRLSVWNSGASYGAKLQGLRYITPASHGRKLAPSNLPRQILLMHGALTIVVPYLHNRVRAHGLSKAWPDAPSSDRRRRLWDVLVTLESSYALLGLTNFVIFLWNGRYRTIADRVFNLRLVQARRLVQRDVSYEFMNRQMVWHAFTEFLLFFLPLINARTIQRRIDRLKTQVSSMVASSSKVAATSKARGKYWSLPQNECAICTENASFSINVAEASVTFPNVTQFFTSEAEENPDSIPTHPINTPYITDCQHTYCYHCIAERMMRSADDTHDTAGWECLRCAHIVQSAERYIVDSSAGTAGSEVSGSDYAFSSDIDFDVTDVSESIESYSESGLSDEN
ncbi:peroxisomal biogenesis factor 2 [Lentinula raphanica]|uniref:RING-type E3 ubiquitin transferase (cysteine targeting) n=1 Tax=Lentinula raphanica TaxID=153919 RepID=A0AA38PFU5_9AGAR|nr:peroxisomal biogenesis factor 2 [Lentinula raphanica]KAJ3975187.1 peroxisomal biogenesis factor 2 [Lentinula raphanica]